MRHVTNLTGISAHTGLPREWLRKAADAGHIPCLRVGRKMLFNREAVERALAVIASREMTAEAARA
jgi:excisionase family DNA binding protein